MHLEGGLFGSHSPLRKRNVEMDNLPAENDIKMMEAICTVKNVKKLTDEMIERFAEITGGFDAIIDYNLTIETDDEKDYRLIQIPENIEKLYKKTTDHISILRYGNVTNFKKETLRKTLQEGVLTPYNYDWEGDFMSYYPEDYGRKLDPVGNWILILDDYAIESAPKKYTIHYATPISKMTTSYGGTYKMWYANILVNNKEVSMCPREYIVIRDANMLLDNIDKGITMIEGSSSAKLDKNKVFYLKSRGFSQAEIYQILFKSVTNKNFCYFEVDANLVSMFDNIKQGMSMNLAVKVQEHFDTLPNFKFGAIC